MTTCPEHINQPHLRRIQPLPVKNEQQQAIALRDPLMLREQTMLVPAQVMVALQQCNGTADPRRDRLHREAGAGRGAAVDRET